MAYPVKLIESYDKARSGNRYFIKIKESNLYRD